MSKTKKIDWVTIKETYLAEYAEYGEVDLKRLATRFGVEHGTMRNHSSKGKWKDEGALLYADASKRVAERVLPAVVDRRVAAIQEHLEFASYLKKKAMSEIVAAEKLPLKDAIKMAFDAMKLESKLVDIFAELDVANAGVNDREKMLVRFNAFIDRVGVPGQTPTRQ